MVGLVKSARVHPTVAGRQTYTLSIHRDSDKTAPGKSEPQLQLKAPPQEDNEGFAPSEGDSIPLAIQDAPDDSRCPKLRRLCRKLRCKRAAPRSSRASKLKPRFSRLSSKISSISGFDGKNCRRLFRRFVKIICKSTGTLIGTAFYVVAALAILVLGLVQLPLDKPYCAREPRFGASLLAWVEEPAQRYAVVWCEYGPIASVLLSFLAFCNFLLAFSMSLRKVLKIYHEARRRRWKARMQHQRDVAASTGGAIEEDIGRDLGKGFQRAKMIPKDAEPRVMHEDYDGRVFNC